MGLRYFFLVVSLSTYTLMAPFGYLAFALFSFMRIGSRARRANILQAIIQRAFATMHHWLRIVRLLNFTPRLLPESCSGPFVIVANHPSLTDTTAIMACTRRVVAVVRKDIYGRPLIRPLFEAAGYLDAGGRGVQAVGRWIDSARSRLEMGYSILIFPEGTRSPDNGLHGMGRVAFELSCQANTPLLAIAVHEEPIWLGRKRGVFQLPKMIPKKSLEVLGIFNPLDFQRDSRSMRRVVEARFQKAVLREPFADPQGLEPGSGVDLPRPTG